MRVADQEELEATGVQAGNPSEYKQFSSDLSLALLHVLERLSPKEIVSREIATGVPLLYQLPLQS